MTDSFQYIISRLCYDIEQGETYYDKKIAVMISDAKNLRRDRRNIRSIDRVMYDYTIVLEQKSGAILNSFNEYKLDRDDYKRLLTIFKSI
jgi:hypothetical protein